jgi:ribosomal protein S18 acetylase RimI-like enzyme
VLFQANSINDSSGSSFRIVRLNRDEIDRLRGIRLRALDDAPDAFATTLAEAGSYSDKDWKQQLDQLTTFVAVADDRDLGMVRGAHCDDPPDTGYLISMWVAPEARRMGIASRLIDGVVAWAKSQGQKKLLLHVAESNEPAKALYLKKGFEPTGLIDTLPSPRQFIREIQLAKLL